MRVILFLLLPLALFAEIQPFHWSWTLEKDTLSVTLKNPADCYVYRNMTSVTVNGKKASSEPEHAVVDKSETFVNPAVWRFDSVKVPFTLAVKWQGCRTGKKMFCYAPGKVSMNVDSGTSGVVYGEQKTATVPTLDFGDFTILRSAYGYLNKTDFIAFLRGETAEGFFTFAGKGVWLIILLSLLGGAALNLTPCVLPMIPINLAIIGAGGESGKRFSAVTRACIYASGMAAAYGIAGVAAVLGGASFGQLDSYWYFNLGAAAVFVLLGLAMFDVFMIDFSRFGGNFGTPNGAKYAGIFLMGALAALLAGACVAPVVIAVMLQSAGMYASGNHAGLLLPFVLGIGMGLPWPLAAGGIAAIPKPGRWMNHVKHVFGVLIILTGCYYGWLGVELLTAKPAADGTLSGADKISDALMESGISGKPVLIDFWAKWCKNCVAMDGTVLNSTPVKTELEKFIVVKFDATNQDSPEVKAVMEKFKIGGLPAFTVIRPGKE